MKIQFLIALIMLIGFVAPARSQKNKRDIFGPVPAQQRTLLKDQFYNYLALELRHDHRAVSDLLFNLPPGMTKENFINATADFNLLEFTPTKIDRKRLKTVRGAKWRIVGIAKIQKKDGIAETKDAEIYAKLQKNVWLFSGVITTELVEGEKQVMTIK